MTWPASDVNTTNADAGTDSPAAARTDLLDLLSKFNLLRNHVTSFGQTLLSRSTAALMRTDLGSTAVGDAVFTAATTAAARIAIGAAGRAQMVTTVATATSITPNVDTTDIAHMTNTQGAGTFTINAPTGTPADGQTLIIRLKSTVGVQTLSFNAIYRGGVDVVLPTTATLSKTDYIGFKYNATDTKWDLLTFVQGY